ncbi:MAG: hypothetical protein KDC98_15225 [Planctomycetes bacterium]|nr:hypothetical protein [Planctomycetota bacterium]
MTGRTGEILQVLQEQHLGVDVERRQRFVEHEQFGTRDQGLGEFEAHPVAAGQLAPACVAVPLEPEALQEEVDLVDVRLADQAVPGGLVVEIVDDATEPTVRTLSDVRDLRTDRPPIELPRRSAPGCNNG